MALVQCGECGRPISDKAKTCPHCGAPVYSSQQYGHYGDNDSSNGSNNKALWIAIVVIAALLLGLGGWFWYDSEAKRSALELQLAEKTEQARLDSIAKAELMEQARQDSIQEALEKQRIDNIRNSYIRILNRFHSRYGSEYVGDCGYFLFDITGDDVPELWVNFGTCEADYKLNVYTYKGDASLLYSTGYGHSYCCRGRDYIMIVCAHMGCAEWYKLTYRDGKIHEKSVFSEETEYDYTEPSEPMINPYLCSNHEPIYSLIN